MSDALRVPVHTDGVALRDGPDGARLVDGQGRSVWALNATALALWELCDGETSVEEMVGAVAALFSADEELMRHDLEETFDQLSRAGLLGWVRASPGAG